MSRKKKKGENENVERAFPEKRAHTHTGKPTETFNIYYYYCSRRWPDPEKTNERKKKSPAKKYANLTIVTAVLGGHFCFDLIAGFFQV